MSEVEKKLKSLKEQLQQIVSTLNDRGVPQTLVSYAGGMILAVAFALFIHAQLYDALNKHPLLGPIVEWWWYAPLPFSILAFVLLNLVPHKQLIQFGPVSDNGIIIYIVKVVFFVAFALAFVGICGSIVICVHQMINKEGWVSYWWWPPIAQLLTNILIVVSAVMWWFGRMKWIKKEESSIF